MPTLQEESTSSERPAGTARGTAGEMGSTPGSNVPLSFNGEPQEPAGFDDPLAYHRCRRARDAPARRETPSPPACR